MFEKFVISYDHRVDLKYIERIKAYLTENGIEYDVVEDDSEGNDYPILARKAYQIYLDKKFHFS